jgi:hypothetical protein
MLHKIQNKVHHKNKTSWEKPATPSFFHGCHSLWQGQHKRKPNMNSTKIRQQQTQASLLHVQYACFLCIIKLSSQNFKEGIIHVINEQLLIRAKTGCLILGWEHAKSHKTRSVWRTTQNCSQGQSRQPSKISHRLANLHDLYSCVTATKKSTTVVPISQTASIFTCLVWLRWVTTLRVRVGNRQKPTNKLHFYTHIIKFLVFVVYFALLSIFQTIWYTVTRVVWTAVVLRCGKQMEKLPHYHFSWIVSFQKQRYRVCEMLGDRRGYSHLKEEALDRIKWRNRFGRDCGPVVWQITDDDDDDVCNEYCQPTRSCSLVGLRYMRMRRLSCRVTRCYYL